MYTRNSIKRIRAIILLVIIWCTPVYALDINGIVQCHPWEKEELKNNHKSIFIYIEGQNIGKKQSDITEQGNFIFISIPANETIKLWWQFELTNTSTKPQYVLVPMDIGGVDKKAEGIASPTFLFRKLDWIHDEAKREVLGKIQVGDFEEAGETYNHYYLYYNLINSDDSIDKHYRLLQEMCTEALKFISRRTRAITKSKSKVDTSMQWFTERLTIASEDSFIKRRPVDVYSALIEWNRYSKLAYTKRRNWPSKKVSETSPDDKDLKLFRWKEAYEWLVSDVELIIEIFKLKKVEETIEKWKVSSNEEILQYRNEIVSKRVEDIDLNRLSILIQSLHKAKIAKQ